jgi:hypothetical protein
MWGLLINHERKRAWLVTVKRSTKESVLLGIRGVGYNIVAYKAVIIVPTRQQ